MTSSSYSVSVHGWIACFCQKCRLTCFTQCLHLLCLVRAVLQYLHKSVIYFKCSLENPENFWKEETHITFVFNATVTAKPGSNNPEVHIWTLPFSNVSCWNFSREGKNLKTFWKVRALLRFTSEMFPKRHDTRDCNTYTGSHLKK